MGWSCTRDHSKAVGGLCTHPEEEVASPVLPVRLSMEKFLWLVGADDSVGVLFRGEALRRYNVHAALEARVKALTDAGQAFHDSDEMECARDSHGEDCDCDAFVFYVPLGSEPPTCIHVRTFAAFRALSEGCAR